MCALTNLNDFPFFADAKISKKVSQSAALNVIKTHKICVGNHQTNDETNVAQKQTTSTTNTATSSSHSYANDKQKQTIEFNGDDGGQTAARSSVPNANASNIKNNTVESSADIRPKLRVFNSFPGRPQLQKFTTTLSRDVEYESKIDKFKDLLDDSQLNLRDLKKLSWSGIPKKMRAVTWRLLSGYLPTSFERRNSILEHKRLNYFNLVEKYFRVESRDEAQQETFRQIHIDMPRMNPHIQLFQQTLVQEMFERILFIWAIRHPASGYVQGINDLATPFFIVFLQEALESVDLSEYLC